MNTRRAVFADPRVRQAVTWAFDFEWTNKNSFYGAYARTLSYFSNTDLAATGSPSPEELNLLQPYHSSLPPDLLAQPFALPVTTVPATTASNCAAPWYCCVKPDGR